LIGNSKVKEKHAYFANHKGTMKRVPSRGDNKTNKNTGKGLPKSSETHIKGIRRRNPFYDEGTSPHNAYQLKKKNSNKITIGDLASPFEKVGPE